MKITDTASKIAREFSSTVIGLSDASEAKLAEIIRKHYPAPVATVARVNKAIRYLGLSLRAARTGRRYLGYFYFVNPVGDQVGDSVYVYRCHQQSLAAWVRDAEQAVEVNRKNRANVS